jgi:hypothetical protein
MDISRAVDEFVSLGRRLFHQLRAEGEGVSKLDLHILLAQLHVLQIEATRLMDPKPKSLVAQPSALASLISAHHSVEFYKDDVFLIDSVTAFIKVGLDMLHDTVIVVATKKLREAVATSLQPEDFGNKALLFFDAEDVLSQCMVNNWPNESRFMHAMSMSSQRARVRMFQEMTSLLWTQATPGAAIRLEELWNMWIAQKPITLLCAYPTSHFSGDEGRQFQDKVCEQHRYMNIQRTR